MKTIEYRFEDKSSWPRGPWDDEPDKIQFPDPATGMPCLIVRNMAGALCGYVGVPKGHPLYGKHYEKANDKLTDGVHWGLTFSGGCSHGGEDQSICHIPDSDESDKIWWFGFDCAHAFDYMPSLHIGVHHRKWIDEHPEHHTYRDVAYVKAECAKLARQLKAIANGKIQTSNG